MTEAEWLKCQVPARMLKFLHGRASDRKLRLFAVACCRCISHLLKDDRLRGMVEVAEGIADGLVPATGEEFSAAQDAAFDALNQTKGAAARLAARAVIEAAFPVWSPDFALRVAMTVEDAKDDTVPRSGVIDDPIRPKQASLLREIFGLSAFRPVVLDPDCQTPAVLTLATAAYDNRHVPSGQLEPERLAVLADALEESGCDNAELLGHLRGEGVHVRGCFAVDAVLAKE
jgi:hypothetical protein